MSKSPFPFDILRFLVRYSIFTLLVILGFLGAPICQAQEGNTPSGPQTNAPQGYPVVLGNQTLFTITQEVEGYLPQDRANGMSERIKRIADDLSVPISAVKTFSFDIPISVISARNILLAGFSAQDAGAVGLTREELAAKYAEKLRIAMETYRKERSLGSIISGTLYTVVATVALILILVLLQRLYRKINAAILTRVQPRIRSVQIQSFELVRAEHLRAVLLGAVKFIRFLFLLLVVYTYVQLVLGFFPWTRPLANELLDYVLVPVAAIAGAVATRVPDLIFIVILVIIAKYLLKIMKFFFLEVEKGTVKLSGFYPEWAKPTYKILSLLVIGC